MTVYPRDNFPVRRHGSGILWDLASDDSAAGYINFYVCNGAVIAPEFGDAQADNRAKQKLQKLFPDREIVQLSIDGNPNQRYALLFRDYLRAHPNSARSIELIKHEIAKRHAEDKDAYYDIKDPVYDLIWDAASDWSRQIDWKPS